MYPFDPETLNVLTELQSIDALAEAEAGILSCMSDLLYQPTSTEDLTPIGGTLISNISLLIAGLATPGVDYTFADVAEQLKQILCGFACKEAAIADIVNSLACKLSIDKGVSEKDCDKNPCCCCFVR